MSPAYRKYRKSFLHSYAFGVYATRELLQYRPEFVRRVLLRDSKPGGQGLQQLLCQARRQKIPIDTAPRAIARLDARAHSAVGVFEKYNSPIRPETNHVVLVQPRYAGNVGTILRSMLGFGLSDLAVIRPCPDLLSPGVVRASQGAVFQLRWSCFPTFREYRKRFSNRQFYCLAVDGSRRVQHLEPRDRFALIFGAEGSGLTPEIQQKGTTIRIDHHPEIDSLNLGVAAGIVFHQVAGVAAAGHLHRRDG